MIRRFNLVLVLVTCSLGLAACGTLERPDGPLRIAPSDIQRVADPRIRANDVVKLQALANEMATRIGGGDRRGQAILALSGGGANGAYGAGTIVGWTERGDRPTFGLVTGISTGALAAPFAFLGPDWDDELRTAYTGGGTAQLLSPSTLAAFRAPALFSSRVLRALVEENVTPELLQAIAVEHAKGRRLLVATTNLDSEETVIWDMGAIAAQGEIALPLFRDVLVASASIPGVFPPVLIPGVSDDNQVIMEMHVDGGVNTPFLAIPEDLLLWTSPRRGRTGAALYIVVNGQMGRTSGVTPGRLDGILARTYDSMSKATLRTSLAATAGFASRNGVAMSLSAIPDNVSVSSLKFDTATMQALFELGRSRAASGLAWSSVSLSGRPQPFLAPVEVPEDEIPDELKIPVSPGVTPPPEPAPGQ